MSRRSSKRPHAQRDDAPRNTHAHAARSSAAAATSASSAAAAVVAVIDLTGEDCSKRARLSPAPACFISQLAVVELQLVLQCLDNRSRICAARCSRQTLAAASHPFAWRHSEEITFKYDSDTTPADVATVCTSLMRFTPTSLHVAHSVEKTCAWIKLPNLQRLILACGKRHVAKALTLFKQHNWVQNLRTLRLFTIESSSKLLSTLSKHMTQLQSIELHGMDSVAGVASLPEIPSLTSVSVCTAFEVDAALPLMACRTLRSLHLNGCRFSAGNFKHLFTSPHLASHLEELRLDGFVADDSTAEGQDRVDEMGNVTEAVDETSEQELRETWPALAHMHTLSLDEAQGVENVIRSLQSAPSLRLLRLRFTSVHDDFLRPEAKVSAASIQALLNASPQLQVCVEYRQMDACEYDCNPRAVVAAVRAAVPHPPTGVRGHDTLLAIARLPRVTPIEAADEDGFQC